MKAHALLSPSKSSRWLVCPPSARLEDRHKRSSSEAADEGTLAHHLSELLILYALKRTTKLRYLADLQGIRRNQYYNSSMMEHCETFASYVMEKYTEMQTRHKHVDIFLEVHLDLSKWIPESFGTGDIIIIGDNELLVIDLKYGKGIHVEADENTQMMIYALGAMDCFDMLFVSIKTVSMTIYQPRLDNHSTFTMTAKNLLEWAKGVLKGRAKLAFEGKGKFVAGDHCQFCAVKATCKANADHNMKLAQEEFDIDPAELKDAQLVKIYLQAKNLHSWLRAVEEYMLEKAIAGKNWRGLKLVHGRSSRVIINPVAVMKILQRKKLPKENYLSEPALLGITALEKNIGAKEFYKLAGKYVDKPVGKPSLVNTDNKGKDYDVNESAKDEFNT